MLTSRGRYYRRKQLERLVILAQREYLKKGIHLKQDKIKKYILEKQVRLILNQRTETQKNRERDSLIERKKFFDQNYEKKK